MSDNTPIDGKKNSEMDAAAAPDLNEPAHSEPEQSEVPGHAASAPVQEPIVIDYDSINADLSAAELDDAASVTPDLSPTSTAGQGEDDEQILADDYADPYASTETVPATSTVVDPEPAVPVAFASAPPASVPPVAVPPVDTAPSFNVPPQAPIYVQAPTKPKDRSNRGGGILIALLATVVFTVLYAIAAFIIIGLTSSTIDVTMRGFTSFAGLPVFYVPVIFFFLAYSALIAVVNRGGWWAYVLFGFLVAVVVYFSYIGGALLGLYIDGRFDALNSAELGRVVGSLWLNPGAIAAGLIAREVSIWAGAWIARRGRRVTARNLAARTEYERLLADGPQVTHP